MWTLDKILGNIGVILIILALFLNPLKRRKIDLLYGNLYALKDTPILMVMVIIGVLLLIIAGKM